MFYKALGYVTWRLAKRYLRSHYGGRGAARIVAPVVGLAIIAVASGLAVRSRRVTDS